MAARKGEWVYDELLNFAASPLFQAPVLNYMEANCLIFDPSVEECKEYREIHGGYAALVTVLLDSFREDTKLSHENIIKAMIEMNKKADLREVFSGLFELILATESFKLFARLMTQKNIELQTQALMLIMKQIGHCPDSMKTGRMKQREQQASKVPEKSPEKPSGKAAPATSPAPTPAPALAAVSAPAALSPKAQEEEVFQAIMKTTASVSNANAGDEDKLKSINEMEANLLETERQNEQIKLAAAMKSLTFDELAPSASSAPKAQAAAVSSLPMPRLPAGIQGASPAMSGDAAAQWIAQAKAESSGSSGMAAVGASFAQMTPEELKKRQLYLNEQREKLMAMKQKERAKQLDSYEKKTPMRPKSAKMARSNLSRAPQQPNETVDTKTIEMRKAIANRLKAEVIENQHI